MTCLRLGRRIPFRRIELLIRQRCCSVLFLDFQPHGILGRYHVERMDAGERAPQRQKEESLYRTLCERAKEYNALSERIDQIGRLPNLAPAKFYTDEDFPLWMLSDMQCVGIREIPCDQIVGTNWANLPDELIHGPYPKHGKLRRLLAGYLNLNPEGRDTASEIPPFPLYHVLDFYFHNEGNHRLYASRLLGRPTVKVELWESNYLEMLRTASLHMDRASGFCRIEVPKKGGAVHTYDVSFSTLMRFSELQWHYTNSNC